MKNHVKRLREYEKTSGFEEKKILEAMKRVDGGRKPTSVALEERTIAKLKKIAKKKSIPYQVLMRMFIMDGIERIK